MRIISIYDFNMRNMIQWLKDKAMRCDDKTRSLSYDQNLALSKYW